MGYVRVCLEELTIRPAVSQYHCKNHFASSCVQLRPRVGWQLWTDFHNLPTDLSHDAILRTKHPPTTHQIRLLRVRSAAR